MNSRNSVNEKLVNFPAELPTLNQREVKDSLLGFSFDHLYACHSENAERRPTVQLDKEVEISSHCVVGSDEEVLANAITDITNLNERLAAAEQKNKRLNELVVSHLDLIQQQNDELTKKEKLYQALKQENETLKSRLNRMDRRVTLNQRHNTIFQPPPPVIPVRKPIPKTETRTSSQVPLNSVSELLLPDNKNNPYVFDSSDKETSVGITRYETKRSTEKVTSTYIPSESGASSALKNTAVSQNPKMIETKRSYLRKDVMNESRKDSSNLMKPLFPVSTSSTTSTTSTTTALQKMQRNRKKPTASATSTSRASKSPAAKVKSPEPINPYDEDNIFDRSFIVNKKSKLINTYGNKFSRNGGAPKKMSGYTGMLCDRLQLIDTTPTGEDPYQLGEADMREQSPIPKLMLQKTNQGRMKVCSTDTSGTVKTRRIYEPPFDYEDEPDLVSKVKLNRYNVQNTYMHPSEIKKEPDCDEFSTVDETDLDIVKTEPEIDWSMYSSKSGAAATSLCDFSYGETTNNLTSRKLPNSSEFQFKSDSGLYKGSGKKDDYSAASVARPEAKKRVGRVLLLGPNTLKTGTIPKTQEKRPRKRAFSATSLLKSIKNEQMPKIPGPPKPKQARAAKVFRGKKIPLPGMETVRPYHTQMGDPDNSWYLGLDPEIKLEDIDQPGAAALAATVEVPRWREFEFELPDFPFDFSPPSDDTEDLDDIMFERRHQKLEAEERRQLRWHMRRIREQRHVDRLRQRQRDSWFSGSGRQPSSTYTIWQQPQRDVRFIEIADSLPVTAFGEAMPAVPTSDFMLPWVRASRALKRSNRSKTLH